MAKMRGVSLTMLTRDGIRTYVYECNSPVTLATIVEDTVRLLDPAFGESLVSVEVN